jgi:hypothetical protein
VPTPLKRKRPFSREEKAAQNNHPDPTRIQYYYQELEFENCYCSAKAFSLILKFLIRESGAGRSFSAAGFFLPLIIRGLFLF